MGKGLRGKLEALALALVSSLVALVLAEGGLRLAVNKADFLHATMIQDAILGSRIQPLTTGHDALGFRNDDVPTQVNIVAIGDSNTYGVSAPREGSWPHQLNGVLGESVYNMGLGGFGPLQYLHLAQVMAKPMQARAWVVGFYFGNDLMDAYYVAHGTPHWRAWRLSEGAVGGNAAAEEAARAAPKKRFEGLRNWLARHSLLYSVLRATVFQRLAAHEREELVRQAAPDVQWAWSDPVNADVRTVFTPQGRLAALDLGNATVREGMQISQRALLEIQAEADKQGVKLLVVLIPTKERAYCAYLQRSGATMPTSHAGLCDAEASAKAELVRSFEAGKVRYVDATSALEDKISQHVQLYPTDSDGHLQATGYGVVAQVVAEAIRRHAPKP